MKNKGPHGMDDYEPTGTSSSARSQVPRGKPYTPNFTKSAPHDALSFLEGDKILSTIVTIESPFAGRGANWLERRYDAILNLRYARACVRNSLMRGESPFASHLLYTQRGILRDRIPGERTNGIDAGLRFQEAAAYVAVYFDRGITPGMKLAMAHADRNGKRCVYRSLYDNSFEEDNILGVGA